MKKITIAVIFVVLALILSSQALYANPPEQDDLRDKDFARGMDPKREDIFKDLNLTAQQKKMLEENKNKHREEMKATFDAIREKEDLLRNELQKPSLDINKVTQINEALKKIHAGMQDQKLAGILEVRKILSPDQFKKFTKKMEERREKEHGHKTK